MAENRTGNGRRGGRARRAGLRGGTGRAGVWVLLVTIVAVSTAEGQGLRTPPGYQEALKPDFRRRDLATFTEQLGLDEAQQPIVETIFSDYDEAFTTRLSTVRKQIEALRAEVIPEMRGDEEERRQAQDEIRRMRREVMVEMRAAMEAEPDPQAKREIVDRFQVRLRELLADETGFTPESEARMSEAMAKIGRVIEAWSAEKRTLGDDLMEKTQLILRPEQLELWGGLERRLRREGTMARGKLSGESIDLVKLVGELRLDPEAQQSLGLTLEDYGIRLDTVLQARNEYVDETREAHYQAQLAHDQDTVRAIEEHQAGLHRAVRDVNMEFFRIVRSSLPPESGVRFVELVNTRAFPRVYRPTRSARTFTSALALRGLDEETLDAIRGIEASYLEALVSFNERLRAIVLKHEPEELARGGATTGTPIRSGSPDPIRAGYDERRDLGQSYMVQLEALLTPEQIKQLPGGRARSFGASPGDRRAAERNSVLGGQQWALETFDMDGDGSLSDEEIDLMRDYLRENRGRDNDGGG